MAEDEAANDETLNDIEDSDIRTGVYEGGFKTWECSVDLASILLDRGPRKDIDELFKCDQIVEVCLTARSPTATTTFIVTNDYHSLAAAQLSQPSPSSTTASPTQSPNPSRCKTTTPPSCAWPPCPTSS
jgi:hypothetical protein